MYHKTLSAYYPHLLSLYDFLLPLELLGSALLSVTDPAEYRLFLTTTICAPNAQAPSLPAGGGAAVGSQQEAVDRVLLELSRRIARDGRKDALLAAGRRTDEHLPINAARPGLESSGGAASLRGLSWRILRARIGDVAFRHIILHTSLFHPVGNNCFVQLSGTPIYDLYGRNDQAQRKCAGPGAKRKETASQPQVDGRTKKRRRVKAGHEDASPRVTSGASPSRQGPADRLLPRQKMFYGRPCRSASSKVLYGLPPHHVLHASSRYSTDVASDLACLSLIQAIFPSMFDRGTTARSGKAQQITRPKGSRSRVLKMVGMARELLERHRRTDYARLLKRCIDRSRNPTIDGLQPVSHSQVCRYVASVLKSVFPCSIVGSPHNAEVLSRHTRDLVRSKQHETLNLHTLMQDLRINDMTWLACDSDQRFPPAEANKRRQLAEDLVYWIFSDFLIPLLRNSFYITETSQTRYETVYYSHAEWEEAAKPHFQELQRSLLEELDRNEAYFALQGQLGVSAVRLIPKPNGFRPIVNLGKRIKHNNLGISTSGMGKKGMTANQVLRGVHQILTLEKDRKRDQLGSALFGTNEIFAPLAALKQELGEIHGRVPPLYFVKTDIKAAFDTIKQDKMLDVVSKMLDKHHDYCVMMYSLLLPPASRASQGSARRLFKTRALTSDEASMPFHAHAESIVGPLRNAVLVDLARRKNITKNACMQLLRTHIKENVWQIGDKLYRQKEGIPQGSKISSLLCSFFYAALEAEHLRFVNQPGTRLLRYIDDFLLVTDSLPLAKRFVKVTHQGFPAYGAFVSPSKTLLSFDFATDSQVPPVCLPGQGGSSYFPYCGFLIDTKTLEMSMDHPRLLTMPVQQTFAHRSTRRRGGGFVGWFSRQLENRNHIGYLDTVHNTAETVYLNVYLNFALAAMKVPHYFGDVLRQSKMSDRRAKLIFDSLCLSAEYTFIAGRARVSHASRRDAQFDHYSVKRADFLFIAHSAIARVLKCKASQFRKVIRHLTKRLAGRGCRGMDERHRAVLAKGWEAVKNAHF